MSTKTGKRQGAGVFLLPLAMAVPIIAAAALAILRFGPRIQKLVSILIKMVVKV